MRYLLVPGRGVPTPEHWMSRWAGAPPQAQPRWQWAPVPPGPPLVLADRIAALDAAVAASAEPVLLVAHSGGCIATVMWAASHTGPVHAALLVTPPVIDGFDPESPEDVPWRVPMAPLPFRTALVASRTDPYCTFDQSRAYAEAWGASLVDAGDAGHLDTTSGYGPWAEGERLVADLSR